MHLNLASLIDLVHARRPLVGEEPWPGAAVTALAPAPSDLASLIRLIAGLAPAKLGLRPRSGDPDGFSACARGAANVGVVGEGSKQHPKQTPFMRDHKHSAALHTRSVFIPSLIRCSWLLSCKTVALQTLAGAHSAQHPSSHRTQRKGSLTKRLRV